MHTHAICAHNTHTHTHTHTHTRTQEFPPYPPARFSVVVPTLNEHGIDLLERHLVCYPAKRITAEEAMAHEYFADIDPAIKV